MDTAAMIDTMMVIDQIAVGEPVAGALMREYLADIIERYHGRPATDAEVSTELERDPTTEFARFLVATRDGATVGCAALRAAEPGVVELKRMFVRPSARGGGIGAALVAAAERHAADLGAHTVVLDTRSDLAEARRLYARCGYVEFAGPGRKYADHWFRKVLRTPDTTSTRSG